LSAGKVAEVIVEVGGVGLQKPLHYRIPATLDDEISIGCKVLVPLGKRKVSGFVVGFTDTCEVKEPKEILRLFDDGQVFSGEQLRIARWISSYYLSPPQRTLQCIAHPKLHRTNPPKVKYYYINFSSEDLDKVMGTLGRAAKQAAVVYAAAHTPGLTKKQLSEQSGASYQVIDSLVNKELLKFTEKTMERKPFSEFNKMNNLPQLSEEQTAAVAQIKTSMENGLHKVFLLHGVTGSGKTEVYLRSIAHALSLGRGAIVLVPEISLTPQMIKFFKERYGDKVAVLHSRMSHGERYDQWERISRGDSPVVLGARSAIFAPIRDPGIIIVDEEHEFSYKQNETPRYHARAVALFRAHLNKGVTILGTATPSLESYCRSLKGGQYCLLDMKNRIDNRPMPDITVVDMRREFKSGNNGIFSSQLFQAVKTRMEKQEQAILFLNRRGFHTFIVCRECGLVMKCPNCDISLTYHVHGKLRCHYCGYSQLAPGLCPECHSQHINYLGTGTQKVEEEAAELFPEARILRMDSDTTGRKGAHQRILDSFSAREADILIGTQMIAKGLNLPGVTLVGIVSADMGLNMPDFRASERTFQLITQVSGRAGRGDIPGEVIIQTYNPDHYAIEAAAMGDYPGFFKTEMQIRKQLQYPPYTKMARLVFSSREETKATELAETAFGALNGYLEDMNKLMAVGPAPAPLARVRGNYRLHVVLWSTDESYLREAVKKASSAVQKKGTGKSTRFSIDIDPYNMM